MAAISIRNVWKYYGKTEAVKDLTIDVSDGEFLSILGPSGCGKSSTLRMLAGLEHISAGDIFFADVRVNDLPPKDRKLAMVFENYALYPHKTIYNNIANALQIAKLDKAQIDRKVKAAAELLQIGDLLDRRPLELSGGQKQRTAIGRAIVREPELFLFDEPIAHLDAKLRAHMRSELKLMQRNLGTTMIYVTHDQLEALSMADRIAVMRDGVLQQLATPDDIYNRPANIWVAGFIGEPPMNFFDCEITEKNGRVRISNADFAATLTDEQVRKLGPVSVGDSVTLGVRPDNVTFADATDSESFAGEILITEHLGGDMLVEVRLGENRITVKTNTDFDGRIGEVCRVALNKDRCHLFSAQDGSAIF